MTEQARAVRVRYAEFEERRYRRQWTPEGVMLVSAETSGISQSWCKEGAGVRPTDDLDAKLGHEALTACGLS